MDKAILVADDSEVARHEIVKALNAAGFKTTEAGDGRDALARAKAGDIALIVSDVHMPFLNGIEMCEALKAAVGDEMPPVLVVSTEANAGMKKRGKDAGVKGWIIKPVDLPKLVEVVRLLIARTQASA